jgi:hypothetical protein
LATALLLGCLWFSFKPAAAQQRDQADATLCARAIAALNGRSVVPVADLMQLLRQVDARFMATPPETQNQLSCETAKAEVSGVASQWGLTTPTMVLWVRGQTVMDAQVCKVRDVHLVGC